ncbi:MAG: ferrous iron transport protein A [Oscillospiraceae bacterium]|nr:ferrous iron transport protein A [Oscillospiraceae bacterium]
MITINKLKPSECGVVLSISIRGALRRRIIDMGITPGAFIKLNRTAPFGDPIEITIRGYNLSIRKAEAREIIVKKISKSEYEESAC